MTLGDWLERAAAVDDRGLRFVDRRERAEWLPWSEVADRAFRAAAALRTRGVRPGDRVAIIAPTAPGFFDAFFGAVVAGAVPVPLYPPVRLGRLDEYRRLTAAMLEAVDPAVVVVDRRLESLLASLLAEAGVGFCRTSDLGGDDRMRPEPRRPEDLALIQFSSGTTVDPKPVALSHRAVMAQAGLLNAMWPDRPDRAPESGVSWLPLYHDMGLIGCVLPALERPGTLTLLPPKAFVARPALWLRAISRYAASISPAPNFAFALATERIQDSDLEGCDLSSWRVALNGAEAVAPEVLRRFIGRFRRWGLREEAVTPVYGLSEAALAVTFSDLDRAFASRTVDRRTLAEEGRVVTGAADLELVSVGRPLPGFTVRVVAPDGSDRPDGVVGQVLVQGPSIMQGYFGRPDATRQALKDGWLDTGDVGFVADGELFLTGRTKDVLIVNGRNHLPDDLEQAMDGIAGLRRGCTAVVSHRFGDGATDRVLVFVERRRTVAPGAAESLAARCRERVEASAGVPVDEVVVLSPGTLPRTSSGKIRRQETLRRWLDGSLQPPAPAGPWRILRAVAGSRIRALWLRVRP